jgi:hypothetical protein
MADNRVRFSQRLNEMGDELSNLVKEVEKNRKHVHCCFNVLCYIADNILLFESIVLSDESTLVPPNEEGMISITFFKMLSPNNKMTIDLGLKATIEKINNREDFKTYMQNYAFARGSAPPRGPRREGPSDKGFEKQCHLFSRECKSTLNKYLSQYLFEHEVVPYSKYNSFISFFFWTAFNSFT